MLVIQDRPENEDALCTVHEIYLHLEHGNKTTDHLPFTTGAFSPVTSVAMLYFIARLT